MFPGEGAALGSLKPVIGTVFGRRLKFQTCTTILNNFFKQFQIFLGPLTYLRKYLSSVNTCHVVGTVHFYKYWPFDRLQPNVSKKIRKSGPSINVSLLIKSRILNAFPRLANIWQADKWLGCEQYLSVRLEGEWPNTRAVATRTQSPSKHLESAGSTNVCYKIRRGSSPKIHLAPGTVHNYLRICQTHQSWESGLKRWTNMNYVSRLNVLY